MAVEGGSESLLALKSNRIESSRIDGNRWGGSPGVSPYQLFSTHSTEVTFHSSQFSQTQISDKGASDLGAGLGQLKSLTQLKLYLR